MSLILSIYNSGTLKKDTEVLFFFLKLLPISSSLLSKSTFFSIIFDVKRPRFKIFTFLYLLCSSDNFWDLLIFPSISFLTLDMFLFPSRYLKYCSSKRDFSLISIKITTNTEKTEIIELIITLIKIKIFPVSMGISDWMKSPFAV